MKILNIVLFVLIIIGLGLLISKDKWVPVLVAHIISSEQAPSATPADKAQANISLVDGRQCYAYNQEATADAPYSVSEFIDIVISGNKVSGTKTGTQKGPDMQNGYSGTLIGTLDKDTLDLVFSYEIEGSKNKEQEIYKAGKTGIDKLRYPLIEKIGILIPDTAKTFKTLHYARVGCVGSN